MTTIQKERQNNTIWTIWTIWNEHKPLPCPSVQWYFKTHEYDKNAQKLPHYDTPCTRQTLHVTSQTHAQWNSNRRDRLQHNQQQKYTQWKLLKVINPSIRDSCCTRPKMEDKLGRCQRNISYREKLTERMHTAPVLTAPQKRTSMNMYSAHSFLDASCDLSLKNKPDFGMTEIGIYYISRCSYKTTGWITSGSYDVTNNEREVTGNRESTVL